MFLRHCLGLTLSVALHIVERKTLHYVLGIRVHTPTNDRYIVAPRTLSSPNLNRSYSRYDEKALPGIINSKLSGDPSSPNSYHY